MEYADLLDESVHGVFYDRLNLLAVVSYCLNTKMHRLLTEALKVHSTEFAYDMHWRLILVAFHAAIKPRSHGIDLVRLEIVPVFAIDIALLAVEVVRIIALVILHLFLGIESHLAMFVGAFDPLHLT